MIIDKELFHDIKKKKETEIKEILIFPSFPFKHTNLPFPLYKDLQLKSLIIKPEGLITHSDFYEKNKNSFHNILNHTFVGIVMDRALSSYKKGILTLVNLSHKEKERMCLFSNFSFVKKHYEDNKDILIYVIPSKQTGEIFNRLNYIVKSLKDYDTKSVYLTSLVADYNIEELKVDNEFLECRNEMLKHIQSKPMIDIFKDPHSKKLVNPILDLMAFIPPENIVKQRKGSIITLDIQKYETKLEVKTNLIAFVSIPQMSQFKLQLKTAFGLNEWELDRVSSHFNNFSDSDFSVNFGLLNKMDDLFLGQYNYNKSLSGFFIYDDHLRPLGITFSQQNDLSISNIIASSNFQLMKNYNIFLPFNNVAVLQLFKMFLGVNSELPSNKKEFFTVSKTTPNLVDEVKTEYIPNLKLIELLPLKKASYDESKPLPMKIKNVPPKFNLDKYHIKVNQSSLKELISSINLRAETKSFCYENFNRVLLEQEAEKETTKKIIKQKIENLFSTVPKPNTGLNFKRRKVDHL